MEHGVSAHPEDQPQMGMIIKKEVDESTEPIEFIEIEVNMDHAEEGNMHAVKAEPGLLVKEEVIRNTRQGSQSRCPTCELCHKTYKTKSTLMRHKASAHGTECHMCDLCSKMFNSKQSLTQHHKRLHGEEELECEVCHRVYRARTVLSEHMRKVHGITATDCGQTQKCGVCEKEFKSKSYLHLHEKRSKCSRFIVKVKSEIDSNEEEQAEGLSSMPSTCDYCKKILKNKQAVKVHIIRIHNKNSHRCDMCGKTFKCKEYLLRHNILVHGRAQYECVLCNKVYKAKYVLTAHMKYAHGYPACSETYKCNLCMKVFPYKSYLVRHEIKCASLTAEDAEAGPSKQQHNLAIIKEEKADDDLELGPIVLQHMDCNYRPYKE